MVGALGVLAIASYVINLNERHRRFGIISHHVDVDITMVLILQFNFLMHVNDIQS